MAEEKDTEVEYALIKSALLSQLKRDSLPRFVERNLLPLIACMDKFDKSEVSYSVSVRGEVYTLKIEFHNGYGLWVNIDAQCNMILPTFFLGSSKTNLYFSKLLALLFKFIEESDNG